MDFDLDRQNSEQQAHLKDSEINRQSGLIQDLEAKLQEMDSLKAKLIVLE